MKEGWKQLGSIAEIYNGDSINAEYKKKHFLGLAEGYPFIATKDVSPEGVIDYDNGVKIPKDAGLKVAPVDSVFVCAEGGSAGKKMAYIEHEVCFGNKLFCIAPKDKTKYSAKYIYYFCRSEKFREQFFGELTGLIGGVSSKKFKGIECPFPSISEQERIVSYLDSQFAKIDALKANTEQQLQNAKDLFQAALKQYLTPKEGWEKDKLGRLVDKLSDGSHNPPKGLKESEYIMLSSRNIGDGFLQDLDNVRYLSKEDYELEDKRTTAKVNDVVLTIVGTIGRCAVIKESDLPFTLQRSVAIMTPKSSIDSRYLMYFLMSINGILNKEAQGVAQKGIYLNQLKELEIFYPFSKKQRDIVVILDTLSDKVARLQENYDKTLTLCNDLKQALLKSIFE